jgi:glycosyltransferase involved in cell wall biosynthesis
MKVLHIIPTLQLGGAEKLCIDICEELSKRPEVQVKLALLQNQIEHDVEQIHFEIVPIDSVYIPSILRKATVKLQGLEKLIDEFKPDVIHTHLFRAEITARYHIHEKVMYVSHSHDKMHQLEKPTWRTLFNKKKLTLAYERHWILDRYRHCKNKFITISKDTFSYFKSNLPSELESNVYLLHNAVNTQKYKYPERSFNQNFPKKLLSIGSLIPIKNHAFLLDVVKSLKDKNYPVALQILGKGKELENLKSKASHLGIENLVHFTATTHITPFLKEADLYVHACKKEGFGLVFVEAGSAGLPLLSLDGQGNRELIENGTNGFMFQVENPETFAEKIMEVLSSEGEYQRLSKNAVQQADHYDIVPYVDRLLEIYAKN